MSIPNTKEHEHCRDLLQVHMAEEKRLGNAVTRLKKVLRLVDQGRQAPADRLREIAWEALEYERKREAAERGQSKPDPDS